MRTGSYKHHFVMDGCQRGTWAVSLQNLEDGWWTRKPEELYHFLAAFADPVLRPKSCDPLVGPAQPQNYALRANERQSVITAFEYGVFYTEAFNARNLSRH